MGMGIAIFNPNGVVGYGCLDKSLQMCTTTTTIKEINQADESHISIYPNPFSSLVTLDFHKSETNLISISIVDVVGKELMSIPVNNFQPGNNRISCDLSELKTRIYFYKINSNDNWQTVELIKDQMQ